MDIPKRHLVDMRLGRSITTPNAGMGYGVSHPIAHPTPTPGQSAQARSPAPNRLRAALPPVINEVVHRDFPPNRMRLHWLYLATTDSASSPRASRQGLRFIGLGSFGIR